MGENTFWVMNCWDLWNATALRDLPAPFTVITPVGTFIAATEGSSSSAKRYPIMRFPGAGKISLTVRDPRSVLAAFLNDQVGPRTRIVLR